MISSSVLLLFILCLSLLAQWTRWLPIYVSSISTPECMDYCGELPFTPLCQDCSGDSQCELCHTCRNSFDSGFVNFLDGACINTLQYAIIAGSAFSVTFSIFGIVSGYWVDCYAKNRFRILGITSLLCGISTFLISFSSQFWQVLILRALLGMFQSFNAPAIILIILSNLSQRDSDNIWANSLYCIGIYLGASASSLSTFISHRLGWVRTYQIAGLLYILVSILFEMMIDCNPSVNDESIFRQNTVESAPLLKVSSWLDDESEQTPMLSSSMDVAEKKSLDSGINMIDNETKHIDRKECLSIWSSIGYFWEYCLNGTQPILLLLVASCLRFVGSIVIYSYYPVLVARRFPNHQALFTLLNSMIILLCGSCSTLLGSWLNPKIMDSTGPSGISRSIYLSSIVALFPFIISLLSDNFSIAVTMLAAGYLFGEIWFGGAITLLQGLTMSVFLFINWNVSSLVLALLGWIDPGNEYIDIFLTLAVMLSFLFSSICFFELEKTMQKEIPVEVIVK